MSVVLPLVSCLINPAVPKAPSISVVLLSRKRFA